MSSRETCFRGQIERFAPGIVSLTGGGGKTSLLFALSKALAETGRRVLCTTTTRMMRPCAEDWLAVEIDENGARPAPPPRGALFTARPPWTEGDSGKVVGYEPEEIDAMIRRGFADWIVVEADGAAGLPLKAPANHEPVIPQETSVGVAVVGLSCMGRPFDEEIVFRMERVSAITGLARGDRITPEAVARLVSHAMGLFKNIPAHAGRLLFCNQADVPDAEEAGKKLALEIARNYPGFLHGIYVGSLRRKGLQCLSFPTA